MGLRNITKKTRPVSGQDISCSTLSCIERIHFVIFPFLLGLQPSDRCELYLLLAYVCNMIHDVPRCRPAAQADPHSILQVGIHC